MLGKLLLAPTLEVRPAAHGALAIVDRIDHQMVAIGAVAHHHVERRGGCTFFDEPANVEPIGVRASVDQLVHNARVAVEGEHHIGGIGKGLGEVLIRHPVRVILGPRQSLEPHNVDHPHRQLG